MRNSHKRGGLLVAASAVIGWLLRRRERGYPEQLVEPGIGKNVVDMLIDVDQLEPVSGCHQSFMGPQQDAQSGTGYILELDHVYYAWAIDGIQKFLGSIRLRSIQATGYRHYSIFFLCYFKHCRYSD